MIRWHFTIRSWTLTGKRHRQVQEQSPGAGKQHLQHRAQGKDASVAEAL